MDLTYNKQHKYAVHPHKFNLWIAMAAMSMYFVGMTSAYIVKASDTNLWVPVEIPKLFTLSTILILTSSIFLHLAYRSFRNNNIQRYRILLLSTLILGTGFLVSQLLAWNQMVFEGISLQNNVAGAFLYIISGSHLLHVFGGVIALLVFVIYSFRNYHKPVDALLQNVQENKRVKLELLAIYWHFVDLLWLYLFIFFITQN